MYGQAKKPWEEDWATPQQGVQVTAPDPRLPYQTAQDRGQAAAAPYAAPNAAANLTGQNINNDLNRYKTQSQPTYDRFGARDKLLDDYRNDKRVSSFESVLPVWSSGLRAPATPEGDTMLTNVYAKIMDPLTGVQAGESAAIQGNSPTPEQIRIKLGKLFGTDENGNFTPEGRQRIKEAVTVRMRELGDSYRQARQYWEKQIGDSGIPGVSPSSILGESAVLPYQKAEEAFLGRPVRAPGAKMGNPERPSMAQSGAAQINPIDPQGVGDIGFYNRDALSLPPHAQEAQRDIQAQIQAGKLRTAADIIGYAKSKYGFDADPKNAKAAEEAIAKGIMPDVTTPQYAKPDISNDRGTGKPLAGVDAAIRGATDVATRGLSDEMAAGIDSLAGKGSFSSNLARERTIDHYDMQNRPATRLGGQIAGGFMMPFAAAPRTAAGLLKMGAIEGGLYGAGSGQGSLLDRGMNAAGSAVAGAGLSAGLGVGATRLAQGSKRLFGRAQQEIPPLVDPGTGRLNQPLESASMGQRVAAGRQFGIDMPLGAAGDRTAAILEKGLDVLPASAGIMSDARRQVQGQTESALTNLADRYGHASTLYAGGDAAQQGARNWISRFEQTSSRAYNAIPIRPAAQASTTNAVGTLQQLTGRFQSNPELAGLMRNPKLEGYLSALQAGKLSWQDLKDFRSVIGNKIGEQRFSDDPSITDLRALYAGLSDDMRATAQAQGPGALRAFERANTLYAQGQQRIDGALVKILGDNSKNNPEAAAAAIRTIAGSGAGSANIRQLQQMRASMMKGGEWGDVASSLIRTMGNAAGKESRDFSPQTFVQNYANMSEAARNLLFGDGGRKELRQALDQFVAVNQRLAGTNALRNTSNTTPGMIGAGAIAGNVGTLANAAAHPVTAAATLGVTALSAAGNYGAAKLWTNPSFVRWASGYTRIAAAGNERAVKGQISKLRQVAATNPLLRDSVEELMRQLMGGNQP